MIQLDVQRHTSRNWSQNTPYCAKPNPPEDKKRRKSGVTVSRGRKRGWIPRFEVRVGALDLPLLLILIRNDNLLLDIFHEQVLRDLY